MKVYKTADVNKEEPLDNIEGVSINSFREEWIMDHASEIYKEYSDRMILGGSYKIDDSTGIGMFLDEQTFERDDVDGYIIEMEEGIDMDLFLRGWNEAHENDIDSWKDEDYTDIYNDSIYESAYDIYGNGYKPKYDDHYDYYKSIGYSKYRSTFKPETPEEKEAREKLAARRLKYDLVTTNKGINAENKFEREFEKIESKKVIKFNKETSDEFAEVFDAANGKEIMFLTKLEQDQDDANIYHIEKLFWPPQRNWGAYVETRDEYTKWAYERILEGNNGFTVHAHTHPDFSAFSSGTDEIHIAETIQEAEGNQYVVQLIVSNPKKGKYFIRWFDLVDGTVETPRVDFIYDRVDIESKFPGIFEFSVKRSVYDTLNPVTLGTMEVEEPIEVIIEEPLVVEDKIDELVKVNESSSRIKELGHKLKNILNKKEK